MNERTKERKKEEKTDRKNGRKKERKKGRKKKTKTERKNEPLQAPGGHLGAPGRPKQPLQILLYFLCKSAPNQDHQGGSPAELNFEVTLPH